MRAIDVARLARLFVTLTTLAVVWLVASPANAATSRAPVCDPRGAIGFAPPPQAQDPESSIDVVAASDDCSSNDPKSARNVTNDRAPVFDGWNALDSGALSALPTVLRDAGDRLVAPRAARVGAKPGFTFAIERPPQA